MLSCAHRFGYLGPSVKRLAAVHVGRTGSGRLRRLVAAPRAGSACERPVQLGCVLCGLVVVVDCNSTRTSTCQPCGLVYRERVRRVARRHDPVTLALVTLTAPGRVQHKRPVYGEAGQAPTWADCDCARAMAGRDGLAVWNAGLGKRWNRLLGNGALRDEALDWLVQTAPDGKRSVCYLKATEAQRRGALHVHALVQVEAGMTLPTCAPGCERLGCQACAAARGADPRVRHLAQVAQDYGFGHVLDVQVLAGNRAAGYVAKYVSKGSNDRPDVPWMREHSEDEPRFRHVDEDGGLVQVRRAGLGAVRGRATYRAWTASRSWPNTMRALREAQQHFAALLPLLPVWAAGEGAPAVDTGPWAALVAESEAFPLRPSGAARVRAPGARDAVVDTLDVAVGRVLDARAGLALPSALAALNAAGLHWTRGTFWDAREASRTAQYPAGLRVDPVST